MIGHTDDDYEALWYLTKLLSKLDICHWEPRMKKRINSRGVLEDDHIVMVVMAAGPGYHRMMAGLHAK